MRIIAVLILLLIFHAPAWAAEQQTREPSSSDYWLSFCKACSDEHYKRHDSVRKQSPDAERDLADGDEAWKCGDYREALKILSPLANEGNAVAQYEIAMIYDTGPQPDREKALALFQKSADQGNPNAEYILSMHYEWGTGVRHDPVEALRLLRDSAEQDHDTSQYFLCDIYRYGPQAMNAHYWGKLDVNIPEAKKWCQKSAEHGVNEAQVELGKMYRDGVGFPQSFAEAYFWFSLASVRNLNPPIVERDATAALLTSGQIAELKQRVKAWKSVPSKNSTAVTCHWTEKEDKSSKGSE